MNEIEELFGFPPLTFKQQQTEDLIVAGIVEGIKKDIEEAVMRDILSNDALVIHKEQRLPEWPDGHITNGLA